MIFRLYSKLTDLLWGETGLSALLVGFILILLLTVFLIGITSYTFMQALTALLAASVLFLLGYWVVIGHRLWHQRYRQYVLERKIRDSEPNN